MKKSIILCILGMGLFYPVKAQILKGRILEQDAPAKSPLVGAHIFWAGTATGTFSDASGNFELKRNPRSNRLIISFIGFESDTLENPGADFIEVFLKPAALLETVEVQDKGLDVDPIQSELITVKDLAKAACCNLSESFETNASIDVSATDAVSGTKRLRLLGLDGIYAQIMSENVPSVRGLASRTGLLFIPGTWIKSIDINKGAGSVANGYESITGQINLQLAKPENSEKLLLNAYVNRNARMEINLNTAHHLNERWSTALLLHGSHMGNRIDRNQDGFRDVPEFSQFNFLHRWKYEGDAWKMQFGVQALYDDRLGGQMNFERQQEREATSPYGFNRSTRRYAGFAKIGYIFPHKPSQSFGIIINGLYHDQASFWGNNDYEGNQVNAQIQGTFQTEFSPWLKLRTGFSYVYDDYEERLLSPQEPVFQPERRESVPGLFTELTISPSEKLTLIPGIRVDFHNLLGTQWSPRFHGKYQLNEKNIFRLSAGRGFRVATPLNENLNFLISNRQLLLSDEVFAEKAWNYGASFQHSFQWGQRSGILTLDFYRSDFQEQLVVDLDARPRELNIYALDGRAYANSFQLALEYELFKRFDVQMAYKWYDVQTTYDGQLRSQPFVSRNSFFVNLAYATYYDKWTFDLTVHWLGPQRLPDTFQNPEEFQLGGQSPDYVRISAQVTRRFRRWEVYVGAENLAGFRQNPLIIQADQPFGEFFDAGLIYGPVLGRMFYSGFRFKIK